MKGRDYNSIIIPQADFNAVVLESILNPSSQLENTEILNFHSQPYSSTVKTPVHFTSDSAGGQ